MRISGKKKGNFENCLNFFKNAFFGNYLIECVAIGHFALKLSKVSDLGFFWKDMWVFLGKKLDFFFKIHCFDKFALESVSNAVFTEDISKCLEFGFLGKYMVSSKNAWSFSKTQKINLFARMSHKIYNDITALKTFKIWGFLEKQRGC